MKLKLSKRKWNSLRKLILGVLDTEYPNIDDEDIDSMKVKLRTSMEKRDLTDLYDIVFDMTLDFFDIDSPVWSSSPEGLLYTEVSCLYDEVSQNKIRALRMLCGKRGFIPPDVYDWATTLNMTPRYLITTLRYTSHYDDRDNGKLPCRATSKEHVNVTSRPKKLKERNMSDKKNEEQKSKPTTDKDPVKEQFDQSEELDYMLLLMELLHIDRRTKVIQSLMGKEDTSLLDEYINELTSADKEQISAVNMRTIARGRRSNSANRAYMESTVSPTETRIDLLIARLTYLYQELTVMPEPTTQHSSCSRFDLESLLLRMVSALEEGNIYLFIVDCRNIANYAIRKIEFGDSISKIVSSLIAVELIDYTGNVPKDAPMRLRYLLQERANSRVATNSIRQGNTESLSYIVNRDKTRAMNARVDFREAMLSNSGSHRTPGSFRRRTVSSCVPRYKRTVSTDGQILHDGKVVISSVE